MKKILTVLLIATSLVQFLSATGWEQMYEAWEKGDPQAAAQAKPLTEKLKKQNEKQFKDEIDKVFKDQFEVVFGSELKPSEAFDFMKTVEAAADGDMQAAMKEGGTFFIGKYVPMLGTYISWVQNTHKAIKALEKMWVAELYRCDAYVNALMIIDSQNGGDEPYVPSYLFKFDFSKPENASLQTIYQKMRKRESWMFEQWRGKDDDHHEAVRILNGGDWPAKFVSALGKMPDDQDIFNHFLHKITSISRDDYLATMSVFYIEPIAKKEAMLAKAKFSKAMQHALGEAAKARGMQFKPIKSATMELSFTDNGTVGVYQFVGEPNKSYNLLVYSLLESTVQEQENLTVNTDASGMYRGSYRFRIIPVNLDQHFAFKVQDQDGRVYGDAKIVKAASDATMKKYYKAMMKSDNAWSQIVGPDITRLIDRLTELHVKRGKEYEEIYKEHTLYKTTILKQKRKKELLNKLHSLAAQQKADQARMSEEEFAEIYHNKGAWLANYNQLNVQYEAAVEAYKIAATDCNNWMKKNPHVDKQKDLYYARERISKAFNNNNMHTALGLILKESWVAEVGMQDTLERHLNAMNAERKKAGL